MTYEMRQNGDEFRQLVDLAKAENVSSYLEIGCRFGGSLWAMAHQLPIGSRIVGVDLPYDDAGRLSLKRCVNQLKAGGYDARLFLGDSADSIIVAAVGELAPFDLLFIDGGHEGDCVRADWKNYGPMARIVAFHDITPRNFEPQIDVVGVWDAIKPMYRHQEIRHETRGYGIGVLWAHI